MTRNLTHLMVYKTESFGMSDVGFIRKNNEDVFATISEKQFFILADGMGGHNAGEVAASEAVAKVCQSVREIPLTSIEQTSQLLREAVEVANERIWKMAQRDSKLFGMGTTLSCFLIQEEHLVYAHVGDSRLYRFRKGVLEQLSLDHSLRSSLIAQQVLDEKSSVNFPYKNVITKALGSGLYVLPDIGILSILNNDLYFLCSDGLTDLVSDEEIRDIISQELLVQQIVQILIHTALEKGGSDNITVLMVRVNE